MPEDMQQNVFTALDEKKYTPTFKREGAFKPHYLSVESLFRMSDFPDELYYFVFPNVANEAAVSLLELIYARHELKIYDVDGYKITVIHFSSKVFTSRLVQTLG